MSEEAEEGLFGDGQAATGGGGDAPCAGEAGAGEGQPDEGAVAEFGGGDPFGDDADAHAEFDDFFDGFHGAEFEVVLERGAELGEVLLDEAEGGAGAGVEDEMLLGELGFIDAALLGPWMEGADDDTEGVAEEFVEDEAFGAFGAEEDAEVDAAVVEEFCDAGRVGDFYSQGVGGIAFAEFADGLGEEVLAGGGRDAEAQAAEFGAGGLFDLLGGFIECGKHAGDVFEEHAACFGEPDGAALAFKEHDAQIAFEGGNAVADRGLGLIKLFGGAGEA